MLKLLNITLIISIILTIGSSTHAEEDGGRAYYDFGVFAYEDGDYEDAEENLKKAFGINPDNPLYSHYLGKTYIKLERYDEAGSYLDRAWDLDPDMTGLRYDRAYLYYKMENYR